MKLPLTKEQIVEIRRLYSVSISSIDPLCDQSEAAIDAARLGKTK